MTRCDKADGRWLCADRTRCGGLGRLVDAYRVGDRRQGHDAAETSLKSPSQAGRLRLREGCTALAYVAKMESLRTCRKRGYLAGFHP